MLIRLSTLLIWVLMAVSATYAQDKSSNTNLVQTTPGNCEMNAVALDSVRNEVLKEGDEDRVVIAIARLGNGETSRLHNRRRLAAVKGYLSKHGLSVQRIITAEGEKIKGYGRVELYVAGKLRIVLLANPNKPLCVECCDPIDADVLSNPMFVMSRPNIICSLVRS